MLFNKNDKLKNKNQKTDPELVRFSPRSFVDVKEIVVELKKGNVIVVNFENAKPTDVSRIIDFIAGVLYATDGKRKKISVKTYLLAPNQELLEKFSKSR